MSTTNTTQTWSKQQEKIVVPDQDIFDLSDYGDGTSHHKTPFFDLEEDLKAQEKEQKQKSHNKTLLTKQLEVSNWFLVTFLMTLVTLGTTFFYFALEDKNQKIAGLERQISNKADNRVKGVQEKLLDASNTQAITVTLNTISDQNFTIFVTPEQFNPTISKIESKEDLFGGSVVSKVALVEKIDNQNALSLNISSLEKLGELSLDTIRSNMANKPDLAPSNQTKSKNQLEFFGFNLKDDPGHSYYVGQSETHFYLVEVISTLSSRVGADRILSNQNQTESQTSSFLQNPIPNISFN